MVEQTVKLKSNSNGIKFNTIDKILLGCALFLTVFVIIMIIIFCIYQTIPDTLVTCVFGVLGSEAFIAFGIWYIKKRYANKYTKGEVEDDTELPEYSDDDGI